MKNKALIRTDVIEERIFLIRGERVMLDFHLAELYGVPTKSLNLAVKRNISRFPSDFFFQLTREEFKQVKAALRFQTETSKPGRGGRRYMPYVFTEHGAIMLATVLSSPQAIEASLFVVRAFVRLRNMLSAHTELAGKLDELERRISQHDGDIQAIVKAIRQLMKPPKKRQKQIGFCVGEPKVIYRIARR